MNRLRFFTGIIILSGFLLPFCAGWLTIYLYLRASGHPADGLVDSQSPAIQTPNPSKAPWVLSGPNEYLVHENPIWAGVLIPWWICLAPLIIGFFVCAIVFIRRPRPGETLSRIYRRSTYVWGSLVLGSAIAAPWLFEAARLLLGLHPWLEEWAKMNQYRL